jgi:hypothetical protein
VSETSAPALTEVSPPAVVTLVAAPLETVKEAHATLLEEYVGLLALLSRIDDDPALKRYSAAERFVRSHIRDRLGELIDLYTFRRETARDTQSREWFAGAVESIERFRERLPYRSSWRVFGGLMTRVLAVAVPIVGLIGFLVEQKLLSQLGEKVELGGFASRAGNVLPLTFLIGVIVATVAGQVELSLRGFYLKRRLLLGGDGGIVALSAKPGIRAGPNLYDLETTLFNGLGFAKADEKQVDRRLLTFVALVLWALVTVYVVLYGFSWWTALPWLAGSFVAGGLLKVGDKIAARRTSK